MSPTGRPRRRRIKHIIRKGDGTLYDVDEDRPITGDDLRGYLVDGGFFEARREHTGGDCTLEVVQSIVEAGALKGLADGLAGGLPSPGLGGLGALTGGPGALGLLAGLVSRLQRDEAEQG